MEPDLHRDSKNQKRKKENAKQANCSSDSVTDFSFIMLDRCIKYLILKP